MTTYINKEEERKATKFRKLVTRLPPTSNTRYHSDYITDRGYSTQKLGNPKEYKKALTVRDSFENSASKIIRLRMNSRLPKEPINESINKTTFQDTKLLRAEVNKYSPEDFKLAFDDFATDGSIRIEDVVSIVRSVMGNDVPLWIVNKFTSLAHERSTYKELSWSQFQNIYEVVQRVVEYESTQGGKNIPDWIGGKTDAGTGLVGYRHKSSYMSDFSQDLLFDYDNMKRNASKTASTRDLFSGTTKCNYQLPGYSGHIPMNSYNVKKALHSNGEKPRPQPNYLRLVSERLGSIPSYSGYIPMSTGLSGERTTGMHPLTSTGAAYGCNFR